MSGDTNVINITTTTDWAVLQTFDAEKSKTHILVIDRTGTIGTKLKELSRSDLTIWNLFLRIFGCGALANYELTICSVTDYLSEYDFTVITTWYTAQAAANPVEDPNYRTFQNIWRLANKGLQSWAAKPAGCWETYDNSSGVRLLQKVSYEKAIKADAIYGSRDIEGGMYCSRAVQKAVDVNLLWNPLLSPQWMENFYNFQRPQSVRHVYVRIFLDSQEDYTRFTCLNRIRVMCLVYGRPSKAIVDKFEGR